MITVNIIYLCVNMRWTSNKTEYLCTFVHNVLRIIYITSYISYLDGQCRVQSHVEFDPNNIVGGIIRSGLNMQNPHSYCKKTINHYAYVQLSRLSRR